MTAISGGKGSKMQRVKEWLYRVASRPGWRRWALLAATVVVFLIAAILLCGGTDYREDPSALVPRSIQSYVETTNLEQLLRNAGSWRFWDAERRHTKEQYNHNQIQVDIAGLLGERVNGLGTRLLRHVVSTERAAYCVNHDEETGTGESWALFMQFPDPVSAIAEFSAEQSMNVEVIAGTRNDNGVFKLTDNGNGVLFFGVVKPWFIISSAEILPKYAFENIKYRSLSLAGSEILPKWKHGKILRGVYNPSYHSDGTKLSAYNIITGWMAPETRINFIGSLKNGLETTINAGTLTDKPKGNGLWPLAWILLLLLALICLVLFFAVVLVMIGWGGWLKTSAIRAGITPMAAPANVEPSEAFKEDAGMKSGKRDREEADVPANSAPAERGVQTIQEDYTDKLSDGAESEPSSSPITHSSVDGTDTPSIHTPGRFASTSESNAHEKTE